MNAPVPVPDKIMPLVARLGSDSEGERLACLRQLDKVLGRAGLSWTDLATRLTVRSSASCRAPRAPTRFETDGEILQWIYYETDADRLSDREKEFIANLWDRESFWLDGLHGTLRSPKQSKWLRDIFTRLAGEVRS